MAALMLQNAEQEPLDPAPRNGRDEMNLADFPIALVADFAPKGQKTLYFEDSHGRLTVTGSDAYGLPTALDADVIVALIYLTKIRNDFRDAKVNFSRYELIKLLNWPDKGSSYTRLDQALNRWGGVWLVYDKCWWNNRLKRYVSAKMHILESVIITEPGKARDGQPNLPLSTFTWNKTFIESCQADNLRQIDLDAYFSLKSAISKRLYCFLGKRFYMQDDLTFDLHEIAFERVALSRSYTDAGKIKEKLQPAIDELEAIGFLHPLSREDRYTKIDRGQWTVRLTRHSPALGSPQSSAEQPEPADMLPTDVAPLVAELVQRAVEEDTAAALVQKYPAEKIQLQLEILDWCLAGKKADKIDDPAAWLVSAIRSKTGYKPPKGFTSKADRQKAEEARLAKERQAAEDRRRKQQEEARDQAERKQLDAYWASLTPEQQQQLDAASIAQADPETVALETGPFKNMGQTIRRRDHIRKLLQTEGKLPAAEA